MSTQAKTNGTRKESITPGRRGQRPQREGREDGCVTLLGKSHQGSPEAEDTLTMISHGVDISIAGGGADEKDEENRGQSPLYIEGNPSTAFAAQLIPQYESHIRVTKETIQFTVNLTKEIPHGNRVT